MVLRASGMEKRTSTQVGGGKDSTWDEAFVFPLSVAAAAQVLSNVNNHRTWVSEKALC
eukprot:SAG25_NODE_114_length_14860_cov_13.403672_3_plen_58_part_00